MSDNSKVAILIGSDSDWLKIKYASDALNQFNEGHEVHVMSAHRTPGDVRQFAESALTRGIEVIIASAGGSAQLAGVVAARTPLPVIGIPIETQMMGGLDSILSTDQMSGDIPVATVGTGRGVARNAGLLSVQILVSAYSQLRQNYIDYKNRLVENINLKNSHCKRYFNAMIAIA